ncbi:MAG: ABC transporter ATP-binding protein [Saprospiraceae bacterium]
MLQAENIQFAYDEKTKLQFPDINCQKGEQWLLLGQSGSGKTTLLHLLGGLMKAQKGHIKIADTDIAKLSASQLDHFRGRNIGIIFQKSHFVRALTVEENLVLAQDLAGIKIDRQRIKVLLDRLNIGHKLQAKTDALSIGEQQRVAIARALVNRPKIILADEPTSALDDQNCDEVIRLLEQQAKEEAVTLLIVTHDGRLKNKFDHQIHLQKQL